MVTSKVGCCWLSHQTRMRCVQRRCDEPALCPAPKTHPSNNTQITTPDTPSNQPITKPNQDDASKDKKQAAPQGPSIDPKNDPLVVAAVGGHLDVVKALESGVKDVGEVLCASCAAAEAARHNKTEVVQHIALGSGKVILQVRGGWRGGRGGGEGMLVWAFVDECLIKQCVVCRLRGVLGI